MRLLLDTHAFLWLIFEPHLLGTRARAALDEPTTEIIISSVSAVEIAIKTRIGRLPYSEVVQDYDFILERIGAVSLSITKEHALLAGSIQHPHRDPFDRILAAQSIIEQVPIVTQDAALSSFPVRSYW